MQLDIDEDDRTILRTLLEGARTVNDALAEEARRRGDWLWVSMTGDYGSKLNKLLQALEEAESTDTVGNTAP